MGQDGRIKHVKYADSDGIKDPDSEDERSGKGKKSSGMKGQQYNPTNQGGNGKRKADDFVANTATCNYNQCRKGQQAPRIGFDLEAMLNQPCPKHGTDQKPATHSWKDCSIMRSFRESIQRHHGPNGGSGSGSHGLGHGGGGSNSGFQGHGNQGGQ